jgi:hypothetical protein
MHAGHRSQFAERAGRVAARAWPLLLLVGFGGCFDLNLPAVPATPIPPSVTVLTPRSGDTISLSGQVSVSAVSVNGLSTVSVLCGVADAGARTIFVWAAPPYLAQVNFATCQALAAPNPDAGYPILPVTVRALSDAGATEDVSLEVFLNSTSPTLSVQYPPTAQPKSPFTVQVSSNAGLRSFPSVTLDSVPADSVTALEAGPDGGTYVAFFSSTPGLGTDNLPPSSSGVPVPIEVLTDTDRTVRLTVSATAQNGNTTEEDLGVELTRVVWDRYIPGQPASNSGTDWAAQPVAYAGGLVLPLATATPASSASNWLPGRLETADGTFDGFDPSLLPGGLDGGYLASGLSAEGATLFVQPQGRFSGLLLAPPPPLTAPLPAVRRAGAVTPPLTAVDTLLCLQDSVTACSTGTVESLACLDPDLAVVSATSGLVSTGPPTPGVVAGAGGRYLSPNVGVCGSSWNLVDLVQGTVSFGPLQDPNLGANCSVSGIAKLLAVGDGTFVVQLVSNCIATFALPPVVSFLRVGQGSTILGAYTSPLGTPSTVLREPVGVLPDGRLVTLLNAPPNTLFELWTLNSATPDVQTPISGLFDSADSALGSVLAQSSFAAADGSFAVLLSGGTFGVALAAFGPGLQPLWLYLYPRITNASSARLVSAASLNDVYLLDQLNNRAVSVRVRPPPVVDAGTPDAGPPPSPSPGIYVTQQNNEVLVFPLTATGNTAPVRTITGASTGLNVPIGLAQDSQGNLYVANRSGSTVTVYPPLANGNVAPLRVLTSATMGSPQSLAMAVGDDLFASTCPLCNAGTPGGATAVFHFPAGATASDYSILGTFSTPGAITLGDVTNLGQDLVVSDSFGGDVTTFGPGATGNATPIEVFGAGEQYNVQSIAYGSNTLFLAIPGLGVALYPSDSTGLPSPSSTLLPSGFTYPGGVALDTTVTPPTVYLVDYEANEIFIIQTAGALPNLTIQSVSTISGTATGLFAPLDILVVK